MLPRPHRLPPSRLREVLRKGKRMTLPLVQLISEPNGLSVSRFGFIVGGRVDKRSTVRNRTKRLLREAVFQILPKMSPGRDVVVVARKSISSLEEANTSVASLLS